VTSTSFNQYTNERSLLIQDINELERRLHDATLHIAKYDFLLQNHICRLYKTEKESWELEKLKIESALEEKHSRLRQLVSDHHSAAHIKIQELN